MRLVVGYLATPSGDDGLALGIRLARTLARNSTSAWSCGRTVCCRVSPHPVDTRRSSPNRRRSGWRRRRPMCPTASMPPPMSVSTSRSPRAHRQRAAPGSRGDHGRSNRRWPHRPAFHRIGNRRAVVFGPARVGPAWNSALEGGPSPRGDMRDRHPSRRGLAARYGSAGESGRRDAAAVGLPRRARSVVRRAAGRQELRSRPSPCPRAVDVGCRAVVASRGFPRHINRHRWPDRPWSSPPTTTMGPKAVTDIVPRNPDGRVVFRQPRLLPPAHPAP